MEGSIMFTVKVQRFEWNTAGSDVALPFIVEDVGSRQGEQAAEELAELWRLYDNVASAWVERNEWVH